MSEEFLKFEGDKFGLEDFHFDVSSTIPEHELLEFNPTAFMGHEHHDDVVHGHDDAANGGVPSGVGAGVDVISGAASGGMSVANNGNGTTMDPTQLLQRSISNSFPNSYVSPVQSPYTNASHLSTSFQTQRQGSIYDTLESIASPGQQSTSDALNAQYFSPPANKSIPFHQQRKNSYLQPSSLQQHMSVSMASPGTSLNDALSPYASFDALRSPRSMAASPAAGSVPKQQLSKDEKLRRRREFHNQVERRRRDLIKEKIKELGLIVPPSLLHLDAEGKEVKASKTVIINKTVEYLAHLHKVLETQRARQEQLSARIVELEKYPDVEHTPMEERPQDSAPHLAPHSEHTAHIAHTAQSTHTADSLASRTPQAVKEEPLDFDVHELLKDEQWDFSR